MEMTKKEEISHVIKGFLCRKVVFLLVGNFQSKFHASKIALSSLQILRMLGNPIKAQRKLY
jgi:hypothetical protein